jgi:hypothetical protein
MHPFIRSLFLLGAFGLIGFGLFIGEDLSDGRWLTLLAGAMVCLFFATFRRSWCVFR